MEWMGDTPQTVMTTRAPTVLKMYMRHRLYSDEDSNYTPLETPLDDA